MKIIVSFALHGAALLLVLHTSLAHDFRTIGPAFVLALILTLLGMVFAQEDGKSKRLLAEEKK